MQWLGVRNDCLSVPTFTDLTAYNRNCMSMKGLATQRRGFVEAMIA